MPQTSILSGCTIVFDLDGTLVDSAPDLHRALNTVLLDLSLPQVDLAEVRQNVGLGAHKLIDRVTRAHGEPQTSESLDQLTDLYVETYASDIASLSTVFPGVVDALEWFATKGVRMSICTNKRTALSKQLLDALDLSRHFDGIIGADAVANRKPHADHYLAALGAAVGEVTSSLMIGDSAADVGTARGAGAPVAVVDFGYTDTAPAHLGADAVFSHYSELPDLAVRLLGRA